MLTLDEIEDSFDTAFLHTVEDLPDEQLQRMLDNLRALRELAPPSLAASRAREIVAAVLERRHPSPPKTEPQTSGILTPEPTVSADSPAQDESAAVETIPEAPEADQPAPTAQSASAAQPETLAQAETEEAAAAVDEGGYGWTHPSIALEKPARRLNRIMHWFFG